MSVCWWGIVNPQTLGPLIQASGGEEEADGEGLLPSD